MNSKIKKITVLMIAAVICLVGFSSDAAEYKTDGKTVTITDVPDDGRLIAAYYDNNDTLVGCKMYAPENNVISEDIDTLTQIAENTKLFLWDMTNISPIEYTESKEGPMKMKVACDGTEVIFELNETSAAKSLYNQLPLSIAVENYSNNEKIFYPEELDCSDVIEGPCPAGTLAYFSPWGDVVMYYGDAPEYPGLYILGRATEGAENIASLSGNIEITKAE